MEPHTFPKFHLTKNQTALILLLCPALTLCLLNALRVSTSTNDAFFPPSLQEGFLFSVFVFFKLETTKRTFWNKKFDTQKWKKRRFCRHFYDIILTHKVWFRWFALVPTGANNAKGFVCTSQQKDNNIVVGPCFSPPVFAGPYWVKYYHETKGVALIPKQSYCRWQMRIWK